MFAASRVAMSSAGGGAGTPYLAVADEGQDRLQIIDISDPSNMTRVGTIQDTGVLNGARSVAISEDTNTAIVVCRLSTIEVVSVDITDETAPSVLDSESAGTTGQGVAMSGSYAAVVSSGTSALYLFDTSTPSAMSLSDFVVDATNLNGVSGVAVSGNYAFAAAYTGNRLTSVDISNPADISVAHNVTVQTNPWGVAISGDYAYVCNYTTGSVSAVDISTPTAMSLVDSVSTGGGCIKIAIGGSYAFVSNVTGNSVSVVDISNPAALSATTPITGLSSPKGIAWYDDVLYVTSTTSVRSYDVSTPTSPSLLQDYPIPNGSASVYELTVFVR